MTQSIQLIVGLGNPGAQYAQTRHNAGFDYVDALAQQYGGQWKHDKKYQADLCQCRIGTENVTLMKPQTFMNRSGFSVAQWAHFYKVPTMAILVAHDELDLPPGVGRFKLDGGHGGHNGLRDIMAQLGNQRDFYRLRIGIGHPGHAKAVVEYVLKKASPDEQISVSRLITAATEHTAIACKGDWGKAMQELHSIKAI